MYMRLFRTRRVATFRNLKTSSRAVKEVDDLAWLRPIPINFDAKFEELEEKVKNSSDIKTDPEIAKVLNQLITGRKPPKRDRTLRHREATIFNKKLLEQNPSIRLHLVIFYLSNFPDLGARLAGWRIKTKTFYPQEKIDKDIEFNKKLLQMKNEDYDEVMARYAVGSPFDVRWNRLKERIDPKEVEEINRRWSNFSESELLSFQENFRNGLIDVSKLPKLSVDSQESETEEISTPIPETKIEKENFGRQVYDREIFRERFQSQVSNYISNYLKNSENSTETLDRTILQSSFKSGEVESECKIFNAFLATAIRRPALRIEYITQNKQTLENLCRVRGVDTEIVSRISKIIPRQNQTYKEIV